MSIDALLSDPRRRPPGGWSQVAEDWAADRDAVPWREAHVARRLRRDLDQERQEVANLASELHGRQGRLRL